MMFFSINLNIFPLINELKLILKIITQCDGKHMTLPIKKFRFKGPDIHYHS